MRYHKQYLNFLNTKRHALGVVESQGTLKEAPTSRSITKHAFASVGAPVRHMVTSCD